MGRSCKSWNITWNLKKGNIWRQMPKPYTVAASLTKNESV